MYTALTIAGSDSCGGAGIQADIKTMTSLGVYGETVITALTAQNTTGVKQIREVDAEFLLSQLECVFEDIYPDAVKMGMIPNGTLIEVVADFMKSHPVKGLVIDPVMVSTSGHRLMEDGAIEILKTKLLPLKGLITPNIPEAEVLTGRSIKTKEDVEACARFIFEQYGSPVLVKGGHGINDANDYLFGEGIERWYLTEKISNPNTHGTGCTLSSAIAAHLAMGYSLEDSVEKAKAYLTGAIAAGLDLGKGSGPLNHMYAL